MTSPTVTHAAIAWPNAARAEHFSCWLGTIAAQHGLRPQTLRPASSDASFRRYFRLDAEGGGSFVVMDAPPPHEDVRPFVHMAGLIEQAGLHAPRVLEADEAHGFLLLDDLGSELYLHALQASVEAHQPARADALMRDAIGALITWQQRVPGSELPSYDDAMLRRELALFPEWCVGIECGVRWSAAEEVTWASACDALVASALAQPQVPVHRDWMPRNLMLATPNPGILDFQDAVLGPVTYDIASMLRDAFISWDEAQEIDWAARWWSQARDAGLFGEHVMAQDFGETWRALEWMGLQRHLKVLGIFCRLKHRDGKPAYSADLPRFFGYVGKVALRYRELKPLVALIEPMTGALTTSAFSMR